MNGRRVGSRSRATINPRYAITFNIYNQRFLISRTDCRMSIESMYIMRSSYWNPRTTGTQQHNDNCHSHACAAAHEIRISVDECHKLPDAAEFGMFILLLSSIVLTLP